MRPFQVQRRQQLCPENQTFTACSVFPLFNVRSAVLSRQSSTARLNSSQGMTVTALSMCHKVGGYKSSCVASWSSEFPCTDANMLPWPMYQSRRSGVTRSEDAKGAGQCHSLCGFAEPLAPSVRAPYPVCQVVRWVRHMSFAVIAVLD